MKTVISSPHLRETLLHRTSGQNGILTEVSFLSLSTLLSAEEDVTNTLLSFASQLRSDVSAYPVYGEMFRYPAFIREVISFARSCALYGIDAEQLPADTPAETELKRMVTTALSLPLKEKELYAGRDLFMQKAAAREITLYPEFCSDMYRYAFQKELAEHAEVKSLAVPECTSELRLAQDPRLEIEAIAQDIIRSDVPCTVVLASFSTQYPVLKQVFDRYRIPFYTALAKQTPRCTGIFLSLVELAEKKTARTLIHALEQNAFGIPAPEKILPYIRQTFTNTEIPAVAGRLTSELFKRDARKTARLEEMTEAYFSAVEEKLTGILQADDPYAILTAAYAILQKHPYMKEPAELTAAMEIRQILSAVPDKIGTDDLQIIKDRIRHIGIEGSTLYNEFCTVTDLTHPVFPAKTAYIAGCTSKAYPAVPVQKGLFDERYVRRIPGYPSLEERHDMYMTQLSWIRHCAEHIIFSAPVNDYQGKTLQTAFDIRQSMPRDDKGDAVSTRWQPDVLRPMTMPEHVLTPGTAQALYRDEDGRYPVSVSRIENWFRCRYRYFLESGLGLRQDEISQLDARTAGTISHAFFEHSIADLQKNYEQYTEENIRAWLTPLFAQLAVLDPHRDHLLGLSAERLVQNIRDTLDILTVIEANNIYHPAYTELKADSDIFPALRFTGRIDRVDEVNGMFRVIDYKSSEKELSEKKVKAGLQLQLLTYLILAEEKLKETPSGAYYFSVTPENVSIPAGSFGASAGYTEAEPLDQESLLKALVKEHRFVGWAFAETDNEYTDYALYHSPGKKIFDYDLVKQCIFEIYAYFSEHADEGNITPDPVKDACTYCPYRSICRYVSGVFRDAEALVMADVSLAKGKEKDI